jgi:hypothetical protein
MTGVMHLSDVEAVMSQRRKATPAKRALVLLGVIAALGLAPAATTQTLATDEPSLRGIWINSATDRPATQPGTQAHIPRLPE